MSKRIYRANYPTKSKQEVIKLFSFFWQYIFHVSLSSLKMISKHSILIFFLFLVAIQGASNSKNVKQIDAVEGDTIYSRKSLLRHPGDAYTIAKNHATSSKRGILLILGAKGTATTELAQQLKKNLQNQVNHGLLKKKYILLVDLQKVLQDKAEKLSKVAPEKVLEGIVTQALQEHIGNSYTEKEKKKEMVLIINHCELLFAKEILNPGLSFSKKFNLRKEFDFFPNMYVIAICRREVVSTWNINTFYQNRTIRVYSLLPWNQKRIKTYLEENYSDILPKYQGPFDIPSEVLSNVVIPTYQKHINIQNFTTSWSWHATFLAKWFEQTSLDLEEKKQVQKMMEGIVMAMETKGYLKFLHGNTIWDFVFKPDKKNWNFILNAPIKNDNLDSYTFLFSSLYNYLLAKAITLLPSPNKLDLSLPEYANTLTMLAEAAQADPVFKKKLVNTLNTSNDTKATGNAFLILVKGRLLQARDLSYTPNLEGTNLQNLDLRGLDLRKINFANANFRQTNLTGAQLNKSNLQKAELGSANLAGTNLSGVNLKNANLENANFLNAVLTNVNIREAKWASAKNLTLPFPQKALHNNREEIYSPPSQKSSIPFLSPKNKKNLFYSILTLGIIGVLILIGWKCYLRFLSQDPKQSKKH